jgi:lysophospholipase L1-like esterase
LAIVAFGALIGAPRLLKRPAPPPPAAPAPVVKVVVPQSKLLEDSAGQLDGFYKALHTKKVVRITHYGDSPTTADLITGDIRSLLQEKHGDAGHGFVLIAKPWAWYGRTGVAVSGSGWQMAAASRFEQKDGLFGLGGVSFVGGVGAKSKLTFDRKQSRIAVWYLRRPGGGSFTVSADGVEVGRVETDGELSAETASFDGGKTIEIGVTAGSARLFGVVAENGAPGIVYDSIGLNGASITVLTRMIKEAHWAAELRRRAPDLLILNYGSNEADFASFVEKGYETELREAIRRAKAALPETSILLMSPMDRGKKEDGEIRTMPTIPQIVEIQRRVARETGCGFFDTYTAMGGEGTMARWYAEKPRLVSADFLHPYPAGGRKIAEIFVREIETQSGKVH